MQIEQAIFTSADSGPMRGYQLVARSPGVDRRLAQELCRWAPSHASLWGDGAMSWSLNYFPAGEDWVAITRTLYGGPEYSRRGGMQVVTTMLAMRLEQLSGYHFNPLAVARTALALGHLWLQPHPEERLSTVTLPPRSAVPCGNEADETVLKAIDDEPPTSDRAARATPPLLGQVLDLIRDGQRVAVAGIRDPIAAFGELIALIPPAERPEVSFTTGLKPSIRRAFRLHFLPTADPTLRRSLTSQGIHCVAAC